MGSKSSAPKAPNYTKLAQQQTQAQRDINRETLSANRVNQNTPYGQLSYTQTGTDQYGNPTYSANQTLSPEQQRIYQGQSGTMGNILENFGQDLSNPQIDTSQLPQVGINAGEQYQDAIMRRLAPQLERQQSQLETKLANQGIPVGSEAYNNAMTDFNRMKADQLTSAVTGGFQTGLAANQNAFNQALTNQNLPLNTLNALRTGAQANNPNYVNSANMQAWNAPDLMGAANSQYTNQMNAYNANQAANANMMGGLMSLGGTLGSAAILASDIQLKQNIKKIGSLDNGLNLYSYEYKDGFDLPTGKQVGVMAQEVEKVIPEAVVVMSNGYKAVNYGMLGV